MSNKKSMKASNKKKSDQLGMSIGTASSRLRKMIMFSLVQQAELDTCYQCGEKIDNIDTLSIEHIEPWLDSDDPLGLYFSLDNIAFSHMSCNYRAGRKTDRFKVKHGEKAMYDNGCRCVVCTQMLS